jgi:hypothetical protein
MDVSLTVGGQRFSAELLRQIEDVAHASPEIGLTRLAEQVCEWEHWRRAKGELAVASCCKALRTLEARGELSLPWEPVARGPVQAVSCALECVPIECRVDQLGQVELVLIESSASEQGQLWKEMISAHHYLGYRRFVGGQVRYLIRCARGWLGAMGFAACAFQVAARDEYIGWSKRARLAHLAEVVSNARFLLLPWVCVENLASTVLSRVVKRLPDDWFERYGYRPLLLETYVEQGRFRGTCYKAAGWQWIGVTAGRGRQDRAVRCAASVKTIYVYPLSLSWKRRLCYEPPRKQANRYQAAARPIGDGSGGGRWLEDELGDAPLKNRQLVDRLVELGKQFWSKPEGSILQACQGSRAKIKAAYRFLNNESVTMEAILKPHIASTVERIRQSCAKQVVLAIQDTTSLNYSTHRQTEGLGYIGTSAKGPQGYFVHDTLAVTPEGLSMGLLDVQAWARDNEDFGKKKRRHQRPIEAKESLKWLKSFEAVAEAQRLLPQTKLVSVGDREGDIFELVELARSRKDHPHLLVRAEHDRCVEHEGQRKRLWNAVESTPIQLTRTLHVPRQSARFSKPARDARQAQMALRFAPVKLLPPKSLRAGSTPQQVWAIQAVEQQPPENVEGIEWMLLTTLPVETSAQAEEKLAWYTRRWVIELYHKALKSGCGIEERQHHRLRSLQNALALDMIVAWRILYVLSLGRSTPELPCTAVFEDYEWQGLYSFCHQTTTLPEQTPSLAQVVKLLASLGGFMHRKCDGDPGNKSMWKGLTRLEDIATAWLIFTHPPQQNTSQSGPQQ